ncbi:hypothetical protein [Robbsia sp. KACC 23696]|uniref:hypothetical protein n=1 Tax=Robbsia sp. KACC 23696 TaxID=3149231 RepID=UPI00325ABB7C
MKAIVYDHYGDPDVLHLTDWPAPQAGVGCAMTRYVAAWHKASGIRHPDRKAVGSFWFG